MIQVNEEKITEVLLKSGKNAPLLRYLIFEGYLDDTYYQYISFFHEGRMSPKDNEFLLNIRAYTTPNPDFKIDNPDEVIRSMRVEDFSQSYILNHTIMDFLVENSEGFSDRLKLALKYVSENFGECDDFFSGYYVNGKQADKFVSLLAEQWPNFAASALDSNSNADHIARILASVPTSIIKDSLNKDEVITEFLSTSGECVFDQELSFDLDKLAVLEVKVIRLSSISKHTELVEHLIKKNLYIISAENISFIISGDATTQNEQLATRNLTTILQSKKEPLISYIENNYETYFDNVFFSETNTSESISTIQTILSDDNIETERKEQVLESQHTVFRSFDGVPKEFYTDILIHKTIVPSWENMVCYQNSEAFDENVLTQYLKDSEVQSRLTLSKLPAEDEALGLHQFILNDTDLEDEEYQTYINL